MFNCEYFVRKKQGEKILTSDYLKTNMIIFSNVRSIYFFNCVNTDFRLPGSDLVELNDYEP